MNRPLCALVCALFIVSLSTLPGGLRAQAITAAGFSSDDVSVTFSPENPGPNQNVTVSIQSFATDLDASSISWTVNGKTVASGTGIKNITLTTGAIGSPVHISIAVSSQGQVTRKDITVLPTSVDMLAEALTYTPPFFKGEALFTDESAVQIVAVPHISVNGKEISSSNLIYTWSQNDTVLGDKSGYGKNTLLLTSALLPRAMNISVTVTDPISGNTASGAIPLTPTEPFVLLYRNDPLYGIDYAHAFNTSFNLSDQELDIAAVPYYFSAFSPTDPNLSYSWNMNGVNVDQNSPYETFRQTGTSGTAAVEVNVSQKQNMFQSALANLIITLNPQHNGL